MTGIRSRLSLAAVLGALAFTKGCGLSPSAQQTTSAYIAAHASKLETTDSLERESLLMGWPLQPFFSGQLLSLVDSRDHIALMKAQKSVTTSTRHKDRHRWKNKSTGHSGSITYVGDWRDSNGYYCRRYQADISTFQTKKLTGEACFMPNGQWKTKN